jgi:hypothetical protein
MTGTKSKKIYIGKTHYEQNIHFKEVIKMLPEMFDEVQFSNAEISELLYYATHPEEIEE